MQSTGCHLGGFTDSYEQWGCQDRNLGQTSRSPLSQMIRSALPPLNCSRATGSLHFEACDVIPSKEGDPV